MDTAARNAAFLDADTFLETDQLRFGDAWRYELVRGVIVAHAAPSPDHGVILGDLAGEIRDRLRDRRDCRLEVGSGAVSQCEQRNTARIPDAMIRCAKHPRVVFEVVSPSDLRHKRDRDRRRSDLQAVEGVQEIVEIYQDEMLAHIYRRQDAGWTFDFVAGADAVIALPSVGISVPLAPLYERVALDEA